MEPTILRPRVKGDKPLLLRKPKTEIVMPEITRTFADFQTFAAEHSVSLVRITIQELMNELAKRGRLVVYLLETRKVPTWCELHEKAR